MLEKLSKSKEIQVIKEVQTEWGPAHEIEVLVGNQKRKCQLVHDKRANRYVTLGDPQACGILAQNLEFLGVMVETPTTSEKIRERE